MPKSGAPTGAPFFVCWRGKMAFRVILIENEVTIKVKLNNLIITKCGEDIWIPLDDISMIVLDNLASNLSTRLMCQLAEQGIGLMLCNQQHLPTGFYSAYDNHSRASKVIGFQIDKEQDYYGKLWQQIVKIKIENQAKAYQIMTRDSDGTEKIIEFSKNILIGDKSNREAHAAKVYFNLLMGTSFSRGNEDILLNSGLDYGYAVIRGYIARACVGYGLNTQIGIHHKSEYNRFNLVDDLMEPLRPIVDLWVDQNHEDLFDELTPDNKRKLVNLVNEIIFFDGKRMKVRNAIDKYISSLTSAVNKNNYKALKIPQIINATLDETMRGFEGD